MTHISQYLNKPETLSYWRNPTKEDIKFGHGAIHYRDFEFEKCFDSDGLLKVKAKSIDDNLTYYNCSYEWRVALKFKIQKI